MEQARWSEYKRRIALIVARHRNAHVIDFMIHSDIMLNDENYRDPLHFNIRVAGRLTEMIAEEVRTGMSADGYFDCLTPAEDEGR